MRAVQKLKYEKKEVAGARAFLTQEEENCVRTGASLKLFACCFFPCCFGSQYSIETKCVMLCESRKTTIEYMRCIQLLLHRHDLILLLILLLNLHNLLFKREYDHA
jgi:hypothetical protein